MFYESVVEVNLIGIIILGCYNVIDVIVIYVGLCIVSVNGVYIVNDLVIGLGVDYILIYLLDMVVGYVVGVFYEILDIVLCVVLIYLFVLDMYFDGIVGDIDVVLL